MTRIWERYIRGLDKSVVRNKKFKLPPIIPMVFYTGIDRWTSPVNFKIKVDDLTGYNVGYDSKEPGESKKLNGLNEFVGRYIPNFNYELIVLDKYSYEELLDNMNALSMLLSIDSAIMDVSKDGNVHERVLKLFQRLKEAFDKLPEKDKRLFETYFNTYIALFKKKNRSGVDLDFEIVPKTGDEEVLTIFEHNLKTA